MSSLLMKGSSEEESLLFDSTRMDLLKNEHLPMLKRLLDRIDRDNPVWLVFTDKKGVQQQVYSFHSTLWFMYVYTNRLVELLEKRRK